MEKSIPSVNTQQIAARITNAVVQRTLMDNHPPLGEEDETISSQITSKNRVVNDDDAVNRMNDFLDASIVVGLVEEAGVPTATIDRVAASTVAVMNGTSHRTPARVSCGDLLLHIESSRNKQAVGIAEALGLVLGDILNPPRKLRDISNDYEHASRNLRTVVGQEIEFWTTAR